MSYSQLKQKEDKEKCDKEQCRKYEPLESETSLAVKLTTSVQ